MKIFFRHFFYFFIIKFSRREFAERRSNELYKLLQRAEVGIGIDNRPKPWKFCRKLNIYFYCPVLKLSWDFTNILPFNIFFLLCSPIIYELKYQSLNYLTFFIHIRLSHSRFHRYTLPKIILDLYFAKLILLKMGVKNQIDFCFPISINFQWKNAFCAVEKQNFHF